MKHKHYDVIVAWAEGKEVQRKRNDEWEDWNEKFSPAFYPDVEYRIKPEHKPDVVVEENLILSPVANGAIFRLTFDGETGKLKQAEVIS